MPIPLRFPAQEEPFWNVPPETSLIDTILCRWCKGAYRIGLPMDEIRSMPVVGRANLGSRFCAPMFGCWGQWSRKYN